MAEFPVNIINRYLNCIIRLGEEYLAVLYDYLHKKLYDYHVIQADKTPVLVNCDGRPVGSKSYMWVYRSGHLYQDQQNVLYNYHKTRNSSHPKEFLKNYSGICVTDGYQVYHQKEKEQQKKSDSYLVMKQIQAIYREEGKLKDLSADERFEQRQLVVKPLVILGLCTSKNRIRQFRQPDNYGRHTHIYLYIESRQIPQSIS